MSILSPKGIDDRQLIATAVVHGCDCIISRNSSVYWEVKSKGIYIGNQPGFYD